MIEALLYKERPIVSEWAEANLRLPAKTSPNAPGPLNLARTPYMREPLDSITDSTINHIYLVWGAQNGKTTVGYLALAYLLEHDPLPLIWSLPSDNLAKPFSKNRLRPFIHENPCLARHIKTDPREWTDLEISLDAMDIYFTGVTSPARLSSRPIAYVIMDEEAKYEHVNKKEAHPTSLLEERTKNFPRRLILHLSTPNTEDTPFWQGYLRSDMRQYYVPCPHCGEHITLEFNRQRVIWDTPTTGTDLDIVEATARYICPACLQPIHNSQKQAMLQRGEWRSTNPSAASNRRGYHLNSLYSPFVTFGQVARKFCECQRELLKDLELQNFRNSWEALPYIPHTVKVEDSAVEALKSETYLRGDIHMPHYICVVCYDPGELQTHWVAMLLGEGGETWVIDWGTILGIRTDGDQLGIRSHMETLSWGPVTPVLAFVDSGWNTNQVYEECADAPEKIYPTKGSDTYYGSWNQVPIASHPTLTLYTYSDRQAKIDLYADRIARGKNPPLHLPGNASEDLIAGLSGQVLERKPGGMSQWKKLKHDHYGDCVKLGQIAWQVVKNALPPTVAEYRELLEEQEQTED